jgi:hypothetical protein
MDEETKFVFPILPRAKHSKLVSYPVGVVILTKALSEVPQYARLTAHLRPEIFR